MSIFAPSGSQADSAAGDVTAIYQIWGMGASYNAWNNGTGIIWSGSGGARNYEWWFNGNREMYLDTTTNKLYVNGDEVAVVGAASNTKYLATYASAQDSEPHYGISPSVGEDFGMYGVNSESNIAGASSTIGGVLVFSALSDAGLPGAPDLDASPMLYLTGSGGVDTTNVVRIFQDQGSGKITIGPKSGGTLIYEGTWQGDAISTTYIANTSGTNTGDQNVFLNVAGDSGGPAVADSTSDTLTLSGGTGISTSVSADTITIANTGVTSVAGTTNQINVSAGTGAVTISTPQDINTTANVDFATVTTTGDITVGTEILIDESEGIYFEEDGSGGYRHAITWNDGTGNFNIRVGNIDIGGTPSMQVLTETGYAFHEEYNQSTGIWDFQITSASSATIGDRLNASWYSYMQFDADLSGQRIVVFNNSAHDIDFRVKGDTDSDLIRTDAANDVVGIGVNPSGTYKLEVNGGISANQYTGNGSSLTGITLDNAVTFTTTGGAGAGATFDGSSAVTIDYGTVGAASSGHTHTAAAISAGIFPAGTFTLASAGILRLDGTAKLQMDDGTGILDVLSSANSETLSIGNTGFVTVNVLGGSTINLQATNVQANGTNVLTSNQTITLGVDLGGSGTTSINATIQPGKVTYAKMQNVSTADRLLGSTIANGIITELDAGTVRGMLNVADGANNYSLPLATATVRGGIELFSNTDNPTAANSVTSTSGRTYGIQLNASNQAVVNVPWTDTLTNQTITLDGDLGGSGTTSINATIQPDSVTYAKMQNVSTADRLLGSTIANGIITELDAGTVRGILNVADGANNYVLPLAGSGTRGGVRIGYSENGKNYPVELSSEQMFVNVPWTDTNVTITARNTSTSTHYPTFSNTTGASIIYRDTGLTYVPTSGVMTSIDFSATSDIRLKNILSENVDGLVAVDKLRPIKYTLKDDENLKTHLGFSAQDMLNIVPEVVTYNEDTDRYGIKYNKLVPVLVKAIQELAEEVRELKKKVGE
jgi:hypothetical protein